MKKILNAAVVAAGLLAAPQMGSAANPADVILNTTTTSPLVVSGTATASTSLFNFATMRGNLSRRWFNNTGFATNDITAVGTPPYQTSVAIYCNNIFRAYVTGPVSRSTTGTAVVSVACPLNQAGTTSEHLTFAD